MRLKEIKLDRYGPLPPIHWNLNEGIQVIYGPNESGKTLIIEALLKKFIGEKVKIPKEINRVSEVPEGYIILDEAGKEKKLERNMTISDLLSIEPDEFRNIFVVRNTDLSIEEEDRFYERVSDKLAGLWTNDIRNIMEKLKEMGRLTDKLKISKSLVYSNPEDQLKKARKLKKEVKKYIDRAEENGIRDLETKKFELEVKERDLKKQIEGLKIKKLLKAYNNARSKLKKSNEIPISEFSNLKKDLEYTDRDQSECLKLERNLSFYKYLCYISIIGYAIIFAALLFTGFVDNINFLILGIPLWLIFPISLLLHNRANCNLTDIAQNLKSIIEKAKKLGLRVTSIEKISIKISKIEEQIKKLRNSLQQNIGILKDGLEIESESHEVVLEKASEELEKMRIKQGLIKDISYRKGQLEMAEKKHIAIIEELEELKKPLEEYNDTLKEFSKRANKLKFKVFLGPELDLIIENLDSLQQLSGYLDNLIRKIEEDASLSRTAIGIFQQMESEEEKKISKLFGEDSEASEIFEEITDGRYTKIDYDYKETEIFVERPTGEIFYPSKELSGSKGTVDQLYLAIRIALGNEILKGEKGFFILDDAFVFSDEARIERQLNLLNKLSKMGWQILYFTSDRYISDTISQITSNETIELNRIP